MWEIIVNIVTYIIDWWVGDTQDIPFIDPISIKENNINNQNKGYLGYQYEYEYDPKTKNKIEEIGKMEVLKEISKKVI